MLERVLVALDREAGAERILSWVRRLVAPLRAEVRLLAVIPPMRTVVIGGRTVDYVDQLEEAERRAAEAALGELAARLRDDGLAVTVETRVGDRVTATLAAARAWPAEAIALADSPAPALSWWLGRTASEKLIRRASVPVLFARHSNQHAA